MTIPTPGPGNPAPEHQALEEAVATGNRREEVHFERDPNQLVVVRHLAKPPTLPPEMPTPGAVTAAEADQPPVEDVAVAPDGPSVWDARPPDDA